MSKAKNLKTYGKNQKANAGDALFNEIASADKEKYAV